jgi:hypothetical protein
MICHDAEFGAGHLKMIIPNLKPALNQRGDTNSSPGEFWIKGKKYAGVLEALVFMPDWGAESGWYRSTPSPLEFSVCSWKSCPVRKIKLVVHTKNQLSAEGNISFLLLTADKERKRFDRKLECEIK